MSSGKSEQSATCCGITLLYVVRSNEEKFGANSFKAPSLRFQLPERMERKKQCKENK